MCVCVCLLVQCMYLRILMLFSGVLLGAGHNTLVSDFLLLAVLHSARARKTEAHFTAAEMSSQRNQSDSFHFKRTAFYQSLKSNDTKSDSRQPKRRR